MGMVLLTALGVGGATVIGAVLGVIFKKITHSFSDIVLSFAAGVMLAAAVLGLILPSLDYGGDFAIVTTVAGIFVGALALNVIDKLVPHLHRMVGSDIEEHESNGKLSKVLLFVTAIAIHNLPEGIAAGVSFGSGNTAEALLIGGGIALQNIPEGMVIIAPMLSAGISPKRTFMIAAATIYMSARSFCSIKESTFCITVREAFFDFFLWLFRFRFLLVYSSPNRHLLSFRNISSRCLMTASSLPSE